MGNWIKGELDCVTVSLSQATNMATGLATFSSILTTLSSPNTKFPLTLLRSSACIKTYQEDISKSTSDDTPALGAGLAHSQYLKIKDQALTQGQAKTTLARCSSVELCKGETLTLGDGNQFGSISRRDVLGLAIGFSSILLVSCSAEADGLPPEQKPKLCDDDCEKELENIPMVTTESGLQYKDIKVGGGPSPPVGFQVAANYVAMVPSGQVFDSSLEKGLPYIFRVGAGLVVKGLDEGILSMKVGGKRRLYIPGSLAFPKGLNSAPGRPRVAPNSPVIFDVSLEYIPGLESDEE